MALEFVPRTAPPWASGAAARALALAAGVALSASAFGLAGVNPLTMLARIFAGSFGSFYGWGETITKAIPLVLAGAGLSLALKGRLWNIGAEGQLLMGAVCATGAALCIQDRLPAGLMIPVLFAAGFLGGALLGALSGWLKAAFGVSEVISTLMLNYICAECVQYLIYGPWKGETQFGFPYTDHYPPAAVLPCLGATRIHTPTLVLAVAAALAVHFVLKRTRFGFEVRVTGGNPHAADYAGIRSGRMVLLLMAASGGLAGLAGAGEAAGIHHHLTYPWAISSGYGYTAIIAAWLAGLEPLWVIPAALLLSGILVGGDAIQTSLGLPASAISLFNGIILLCLVAGEFFVRYEPRLSRRSPIEEPPCPL